MERKHRSFVREAVALPESIAGTTEERATLLRQIGQSEVDAAIGARLAQAAEYFQQVDEDLFEALQDLFPNRHALTKSPRLDQVRVETLAVIAKAQGANGQKEIDSPQDSQPAKLTKEAQKTEPATPAVSTQRLFDSVQHWIGTNESIVICSIKAGKDDHRYFLIDPEGEQLTDLINTLVDKYRKRVVRRRVAEAFKGDSAIFAALLGLAIVVAVVFGANPWILIPLATVAGSLPWVLLLKNRRTAKAEQWFIVAITTILATGTTAIFGIYKLHESETTDKHADVLACKISAERSEWNGTNTPAVKSPQGTFLLDPGTYLGKYYDEADDAAKTLKVGQSYRLTYHGNLGDKYVTSATLIESIGTCGS